MGIEARVGVLLGKIAANAVHRGAIARPAACPATAATPASEPPPPPPNPPPPPGPPAACRRQVRLRRQTDFRPPPPGPPGPPPKPPIPPPSAHRARQIRLRGWQLRPCPPPSRNELLALVELSALLRVPPPRLPDPPRHCPRQCAVTERLRPRPAPMGFWIPSPPPRLPPPPGNVARLPAGRAAACAGCRCGALRQRDHQRHIDFQRLVLQPPAPARGNRPGTPPAKYPGDSFPGIIP